MDAPTTEFSPYGHTLSRRDALPILRRQMESLLAKQEASRKALAEAGETIAAEKASYGQPNPIYAQVRLRQIEIETQIEDLRPRAASARGEAEALAAKAESVPQVEAALDRQSTRMHSSH